MKTNLARFENARPIVSALLIGSLVLASPLGAAPQKKQAPAAKPAPQLTLEAISRDAGKWAGTAPSQIRWSEDGSKLYFQWNPERGDRADLYELDVRTSGTKPRKVADEEKRWLSSNPGVRNKAETLKVYAYQGDIFLHHLRSAKSRQVTRTSDSESNPRFTFDQKGILFTRGDNLFEWDIASGELRQITDFRKGRDPDEKPKLSKQDEYLEKQQLEMFEIIKKQDKDEKENKERTKRERGPFPDATYLKEAESVSSLQLSPDRTMVTFILTDRTESNKAKVPEMPKYVTKSGYTEEERLATQIGGGGRYKVGAAQPTQKLGIMNAADGKVRYFDMGIEKREFGFQLVGGDAGQFFGGNVAVSWSEDGKNAFCVLRSRDNNDRWIMLLDFTAAKARILDAEHDDAWVLSNGPFGWLPDNQSIWFRSERDGYFHIYTLNLAEGSKPKALTSGKWEVTGVQVSRDKMQFWLTTSEPHPGERQLYSMPITGGPRTRITSGEAVFAATPSPDEKWLALSYSGTTGPTDLYLMENKPGAELKRLTDSYTDEFKSYQWQKFELVTIPDADNIALYARLYKPEKPHPAKPAVIFVHGAGYAQSVYKNWGGFGTTPFFNILLQAGYAVLDLSTQSRNVRFSAK